MWWDSSYHANVFPYTTGSLVKLLPERKASHYSSLQMGHNWLNCTDMRQLSCLRKCHKAPKTPKISTKHISGAFYQHSPQCCNRQCKTPSRGGTWVFLCESKHTSTHWTLCSLGFIHPKTIKTVTIILTNGHLNRNNQVSSWTHR